MKRLGQSASGRRAANLRGEHRGQQAVSKSSAPAFKPVWIVGPDQAASVTMRLPGGIVVELAHDLHLIEQVIGQVLEHQVSRGADAC
jgi:hypothetical protein